MTDLLKELKPFIRWIPKWERAKYYAVIEKIIKKAKETK